jgi:competence protein ComFC
MRCINCQNLSFEIICKRCRETLLKESLKRRDLDGLDVVSLFGYSEIEPLILSKYEAVGFRVYRYLAKNYLKPFLESFANGYKREVFLIGIDEVVKRVGYSHTAILSHYSKSKYITPLHSSLIAKNRVSYARKSKSFRVNNPREFEYRGKRGVEAILIDDVVTTGTTLKEAVRVLKSAEVDTIFALTLADARY